MSKDNVIDLFSREAEADPLTTLLREGARELIHKAVEAELEVFLQEFSDRKTDEGRAAVVRNGYLPERNVQTGIGPVKVKIPKVRAKDGQPVSFQSALVPPYLRKTQAVESFIPWLYLKGVSSGEMEPTLQALFGDKAKGLSSTTVCRLKQQWAAEYQDWRQQDLSKDQWVYIWADGIYSGIKSEQEKLCALVIIGVNERGHKQFLAIEDGVRESTQSWREVLLKLKSQGMNCPQLAIGDGAMGFWSALDEVYSASRQQRCWVHKMNNALNCLPKSSQPKAKSMLHEIWQAETLEAADKAFDLFVRTYEAKYPKATECLIKDRDELLCFYQFPAMHWQSIRTSNPIESTFATIRHRTKRSKGCLSKDGMLHMMFKLGLEAEKSWYRIRGFNDLAKVIKGVKFKDGLELDQDGNVVDNQQIAA